jgi:hypothetical protein
MDAQDSSVIDVPRMKLAKVGKDRERKRGGAGWFGSRGAGSGLRGAFGGIGGGAEAGAGGFFGAGAEAGLFGAGDFMGTGMSLGKVLLALLLGGGASVGAWEIGNSLAASSRADDKSAGPKIFADKGAQKYADTSGVIKQNNSIPNSLGYVNNDGLTDEQRAAKKAAEDAAAAKAAEDAQRQAAEDAKRQAAEDAAAAARAKVASDSEAAGAVRSMQTIKLGPMSSIFGAGGGAGGAGGAGLGSGANGNSGAGGGGKGKPGALAAFGSQAQAASARAAGASLPKTTAQGFAGRQLQMANGLSRQAVIAGQNESSAAGAATPFDNNPNQGTALSGAGDGTGAQPGSAPYGSSYSSLPNGGGQSTAQSPDPNGTPIPSGGGGGTAACSVSGDVRNSSGNCEPATPTAKDAAPYQGLLDTVPWILAGITAAFVAIFFTSKMPFPWAKVATMIQVGLVALAGAALIGIGVRIATMTGGDPMIGAILGVSGAGVIAMAIKSALARASGPVSGTQAVSLLSKSLISTAIGGLADVMGHIPSVAAMM